MIVLPSEELIQEIRIPEDHFAERLADHADHEQLSAIFIHINYLKSN